MVREITANGNRPDVAAIGRGSRALLRAVGSPATRSATRGGFIRTLLGGPGASLTEAFARLRDSPYLSELDEHPGRRLLRVRLARDLPDAEGWYELLQFGEDVYVVVENLHDVGARFESAPGEGLVSFHIRLTGEYSHNAGDSEVVHYRGPHLGCKFQPPGVSVTISYPPLPRALSVTIFCRPRYLTDHVVSDRRLLPPAAQRVLEAESPEISYCRLPVTTEIMAGVKSLVENPLRGSLGLALAHAKTDELLALAVAAFNRLEDGAVEQFSEPDIRRFHRAREILATRFNPPPTISSLARELALNETKLKSGFKALFGHTVFEYGNDCRMQHALYLLREKRMRIGVVAEAVGYQHQGTFASAFKAYFGARPKDVRHPPDPTTADGLALGSLESDDED